MSEPTATEPESTIRSRSKRSERSEAGQLVGLDGSDGARHALKWAAARTDRLGLIQPLTTWHFPWWAYAGGVLPPEAEFKEMAEKEAESILTSIPDNRHLPLIVCQGQPGQTLVNASAGHDLTVVGTRGRSGLKDVFLGSVSSHIVAHATTPVAVVPADAPIEDVNKRVVAGVDGSPNSIEALVWALEHSPDDSTIEVVHTWSYPPSALPATAVNQRSHFEELAKATLDRTVELALEAIGPAASHKYSARIEKRLEYGDARSTLRECQEDCDLLVLGARGRGGVAHMFIGSVTSALMHRPISTMIVVPSTGSGQG